MRVRIENLNGMHEIEAEAGERILHAGLRQGIALPYECATGTCGSCKASLSQGLIHDTWHDAPGRRYLKPGGKEFLMCQCVPVGDVVLEVPRAVTKGISAETAPGGGHGTLRSLKRLTADAMAFSVACDRPGSFAAGQFTLLATEGVDGYRAYSMVNRPGSDGRLDFLLKRKQGGRFSNWLFDAAREGSRLTFFGPLGRATFGAGAGKNLLCIAGGSGIAGMMSILSYAADIRYFDGHDGALFFGVRALKDAIYLDELSRLRARCGERLRITVALSHEPVPRAPAKYAGIAFEHGLVHDVAGRIMGRNLRNTCAYIAGPPPAVDAALRMLLLQARLTPDSIRYDKFS